MPSKPLSLKGFLLNLALEANIFEEQASDMAESRESAYTNISQEAGGFDDVDSEGIMDYIDLKVSAEVSMYAVDPETALRTYVEIIGFCVLSIQNPSPPSLRSI